MTVIVSNWKLPKRITNSVFEILESSPKYNHMHTCMHFSAMFPEMFAPSYPVGRVERTRPIS